ncbi:MAG: glycosyltransferase family 4 protein [Planctomycetaceae bacterium]|nr:glycosyltransferase family 4 protein [Planctomycetaceae bacterium]
MAAAKRYQFHLNGTDYFVLPQTLWNKTLNRLGMADVSSVVRPCLEVVEEWNPDIVVSHGTENGYGLLAQLTDVPVLIELQGILNGYLPFFWGSITGLFSRLRYPRSIRNWYSMKRRARNEKLVFQVNRYFSGRTFWDQSQLFKYNPQAVYFDEPRVLRSEFLNANWSLEGCKPLSIYSTTTPHFLKGTSCLIDALALLRRAVPGATLSIGGIKMESEVGGHLRRQIARLKLDDSVRFLGYLSTSEVVQQLREANVYVIPSYIENSPNNMVEAMAVGTPTIASATGGIPSMLDSGKNGMLFNCGDSAMLALALKKLMEDPSLAIDFSNSSRKSVAERHNPERIAQTHMETCRKIIELHGGR